jgi:hypothetical protein
LKEQQLQSHIHSWAQSTHSWNSIHSLYSTKSSTHHMAYGFHGYIHVHVWILHSDQNLKLVIEEFFFKLLELILQNMWEGNVFLSISWCSQSGDHPGENLAKSGYEPDKMKVNKYRDPFLATYESHHQVKDGWCVNRKQFFIPVRS